MARILKYYTIIIIFVNAQSLAKQPNFVFFLTDDQDTILGGMVCIILNSKKFLFIISI